MSYQTLSIVIREAKLTDFITDLVTIYNTNDTKLKGEIEKIVNGLHLNTTTGVLGEPDVSGVIPITEINARTIFVVLPSTPTTGPKFGFKNTYNGSVVAGVDYSATGVEPYSVAFASDVYSFTMGTQSAGYKLYFDRIAASTILQAQYGYFNMLNVHDATGLFNCNAPAQFNGVVSHRGGHKESIADTPILMQVDAGSPTVLYGEYVIGRSTAENIFVYLQFDANGYNAGWVPTVSAIEIRLVLDPNLTSNLPLPGQRFNFILRAITDDLNNQITMHPDVDIVLVASQTNPGTPDFQWKNYGTNAGSPSVQPSQVVFVPKAADVSIDSLQTYGVDVDVIYNRETHPTGSIYTSSHVLYVKNKFTRE